jgi:FkbM family methyltransferase
MIESFHQFGSRVRHSAVLERQRWLWDRMEPAWQEVFRKLSQKKGFVTHVNGDVFRLGYQWGARYNRADQRAYEPLFYGAMARIVTEGMTVLDIGAHIGIFSLGAGQRVGPRGKVYAFEPAPESAAILARHIAFNGWQDRIEVVPTAASDTDGTVAFYTNGISMSNSLGQANVEVLSPERPAAGAVRLEVESLTLDRFCRDRRIRPDLIKIDVEGAELRVLRGAREILKTLQPSVLCEVHPDEMKNCGTSVPELNEFLSQVGYTSTLLDRPNWMGIFHAHMHPRAWELRVQNDQPVATEMHATNRLPEPEIPAGAAAIPPLVSIIVPVYNGEKYLRESMDSILGQSYPRTEIIVMDDASTDATPMILESYGRRIRVIRQPQNRGIYANANDGIALARGEYIAVYHADDVYEPAMVEREVEFLECYPEAGAVFCSMIFIGPRSEEFSRLELPAAVRGSRPLDFPVVFNALLRHTNHILMCPTAMVRASVHRDVGVYRQDQFRNTSDMDMWLRISLKYPIGILEERLLRYRHFHDSSSLRYHKLRTELGRYFQIMDLYLEQGGRAVATRAALAAHEAHRAQDLLMVTTSNYILDRRDAAKATLSQVCVGRLLGSSRIQRARMFTLYLLLQGLVRLPRIGFVADLFRRRWHEKAPPKPKR